MIHVPTLPNPVFPPSGPKLPKTRYRLQLQGQPSLPRRTNQERRASRDNRHYDRPVGRQPADCRNSHEPCQGQSYAAGPMTILLNTDNTFIMWKTRSSRKVKGLYACQDGIVPSPDRQAIPVQPSSRCAAASRWSAQVISASPILMGPDAAWGSHIRTRRMTLTDRFTPADNQKGTRYAQNTWEHHRHHLSYWPGGRDRAPGADLLTMSA